MVKKFLLVFLLVLVFVAGAIFGSYKQRATSLRYKIVQADVYLYELEMLQAGNIKKLIELKEIDVYGAFDAYAIYKYSSHSPRGGESLYWDGFPVEDIKIFSPSSDGERASFTRSEERVARYLLDSPPEFNDYGWNCEDTETAKGIFICDLSQTRTLMLEYRQKLLDEHR